MARETPFKSILVGLALLAGLATASTGFAESRGRVSFAEDIYPILSFRCMDCHKPGGDGFEASGLDLQTYEGLMKGMKVQGSDEYAPVIVPRSALTSNLNRMVEGKTAIRMPHNKRRLTRCEIEILNNWVNQGAKNN
ncbi:MAG: hypothetical protein HQL52_00425 [Magnetococcales bacterium]|nr:hypothetical protein [Magnetococcales bacterium]